MTDRTILSFTGDDRLSFLNNLLSNDVPSNGLGYAALQTPQGKFLADFFLWQVEGVVYADIATSLVDDVLKRLMMYKLRAKVEIAQTELKVSRGLGDIPAGGFTDPRHSDLGWRLYSQQAETTALDWDALRIEHGIPEVGAELQPNESYILEMGFERLNGVDFKKGCFVGQEIVARMKHKTELRKGLATVSLASSAPAGTPIMKGEKQVGHLTTTSDTKALAYLRFDRADGDLSANGHAVNVLQKWI